MNKYTGVLGVYNCQGAAWNVAERKNTSHETTSDGVTGYIRGRDIHLIREASTDSAEWAGNCAVYCHKSSELVILPYNVSMPVSLKVLEYEVFTVTPVKALAPGYSFAPIGLISMYNSGGAIEGLKYELRAGGAKLTDLEDSIEGTTVHSDELVGVVLLEVKGCGRFGTYSSAKPRRCLVGSKEVEFGYDSSSGLVTLELDHLPEEGRRGHLIEIEL